MKKEYPLATGELDRKRLEILHKLYSPVTTAFLLEQGLCSGMSVLEFGCGIGDMSCWLAEQVGEAGQVTAIDISQDSLDIAKEKAYKKGLKNIEFVCMDVCEAESLDKTFDFIYGKWVLMHILNANVAIKKLYTVLKKGGIFSYEAIDEMGQGYFSFPEVPIVKKWFEIGRQFFSQRGEIAFGKKLYSDFLKLGLYHTHLKINQPILMTEEEKSVMRLGVYGARNTLFSQCSDTEYEQLVEELKAMEQSDCIVAFYRNIIAAGIK